MLPQHIELAAVEYAGRGTRMSEALPESIHQIADETAPLIDPSVPAFLLGHSFGARIAFEVARRLSEAGKGADHLFVSASTPNRPERAKAWHELSDEEILRDLMELNGTDPEILRDPELCDLILPAFRADFKADYEYAADNHATLLRTNLTALGGTKDPEVSPEELENWRAFTAGAFNKVIFPGDHFFLINAASDVVAAICEVVERQLLGRRNAMRFFFM